MKLLSGAVFGTVLGAVLGCTLTMSAVAHELPNMSLNSGKSVAVATSFTLSGSQIDASFNNYGQFFEYNDWSSIFEKHLHYLLNDNKHLVFFVS